MTVSNSIIWGNSGTQIVNTPPVSYSIVEGGFTGTGNLNADPLFVDPISTTNNPTTAGDYHIQVGSPAINAGSNAALPTDTYDLDGDSDTGETLPIDVDGDARVLNGIVDIGMDEVDVCASASVYTVPAGNVAALLTAVSCANADADANVITLGGGTYTLTAEDGSNNKSAFPTITTPITINGNDSAIERDASAPAFRFFRVEGSGHLTLNDLTLTGGRIENSSGAAIYNLGGATVRLNRTTLSGGNSPSEDAGGLYNDGSTAILIDSVVSGNTAFRSGGVSNQGGVLTIINSIITGNTAQAGGGLYVQGGATQLTIINSTISGNNAPVAGGVYFSAVTGSITNSIIWGNSSQIFNNSGQFTVTYSLVEGGYSGTGNIDADPLFVTPIAYTDAPTTAGDYHIQAGSPAMNAGSNVALPADIYDIDGDSNTGETLPIDFDGDARVLNGVVDIGADEVDACGSETVYSVAAGNAGGLLAAISCANANADTNVITLAAGTYTLTAEDSSNNDSAFPTITTPITINGNGATIERDASAPEFRFFRVTSGGTLTLNDLTLTGGLITNSSGGAIYSSSGATVRLNRTTLSGNTSVTSDAGGLYNDGGTAILIDSTVSGNTARRSGGLSNQSGQMTIINSMISGNTAEYGGGLFMQGGPAQLTIINSVISGNTATVFQGGGMTLNSGTATIINSTIAGNTASDGGGIYRNSSAVLNLTNSIVWGNSSQIINNGGSTTVTYSLVEGGYTGMGNLDADPLFVNPIAYTSAPTTAGNYELQDASPAINVGSNAALPVDTYDLDGDSDTVETLPLDILLNARVYNFVVDMGAYENGAVINRLTNGSFETAGTTGKTAQGWKGTRLKTTDKRLCTKVNKPITTTDGNCVFQFSGGNSLDTGTRGIKHVINAPSWGSLGGSLTLSAQAEANKLKTGAKMILTVTYNDSTTGKVVVVIPSGTYAFSEISNSLALTKPVTKVVINVKIGKTGGRVRLDEVALYLTPTTRALVSGVRDGALALPLPAVPDGFRGGN
jgi:hypothetical protein